MKVVVWVLSGLLAVALLFIGGTKVITPSPDLEATANGVPVVLLKIAGVAEVLGAIGLVVPAATRILPILAPIAASGLVLTMIGATITNFAIGMPVMAVMPIVLGVLAALVAWARFGRYAIEPRQAGAEGAGSVTTRA